MDYDDHGANDSNSLRFEQLLDLGIGEDDQQFESDDEKKKKVFEAVKATISYQSMEKEKVTNGKTTVLVETQSKEDETAVEVQSTIKEKTRTAVEVQSKQEKTVEEIQPKQEETAAPVLEDDTPRNRWSSFEVSKLSNAVACNHCYQSIKQAGKQKCIREYPFRYVRKTTGIFYHDGCYTSRIDAEMKLGRVQSEFMLLC